LVTLPLTERQFLITDAAITVLPDYDTMLDIVRNAVEVAIIVGILNPRVAILSATEQVTEKLPSAVAARRVTLALEQELSGRATMFGPLAMDNAVSMNAAKIKGIDNSVRSSRRAGRTEHRDRKCSVQSDVHLMGATAAGIVLGSSPDRAYVTRRSAGSTPPFRRYGSVVRESVASPDPEGATLVFFVRRILARPGQQTNR
jgi:phosphate acetyltransferase